MRIRPILLAGIFFAIADAQEFRATLSGRINDSQQAVIGQAKITAVQVETGECECAGADCGKH